MFAVQFVELCAYPRVTPAIEQRETDCKFVTKKCLKFLYTGDQVVRDDDHRMYSMMIMAEQIMHSDLWVATSLSIL